MADKYCHKCSHLLPVESFYKASKRPDGRQTQCIKCQLANSSTPKARVRQKNYYDENVDTIKRRSAQHKKDNREYYRKLGREAFARTGNTAKRLEQLRAYQLRKRKAMPAWANRAKILEFYQIAKAFTKITGVKHEVDHIVPLLSPVVCGLHCEANLQVLTCQENRAKSNRI